MRKRLNEDDPDWEYRPVVEPDGFVVYNQYFYKRKRAPRVVVDSPKARALSSYRLIEKDLRNCATWLRHIQTLAADDPRRKERPRNLTNVDDRDRYNLVKGLFVAALTIYGKCFSHCEGRNVKLEKNNIDESFHEIHDDAMSFRHNFAAHSGGANYEFAVVVVALDPKRRRGTLPKLVTELAQPDSWGWNQVDRFLELSEHAREFALHKLDTLTTLVEQEVLKRGPEYWYPKAK